ncbi:MAG TPA: hypothetical protein PKJ66_07580, partial [Rhodocyclaceae bacterium]|nr:hypothetical protein [Rhodocyclaceae bacterium]
IEWNDRRDHQPSPFNRFDEGLLDAWKLCPGKDDLLDFRLSCVRRGSVPPADNGKQDKKKRPKGRKWQMREDI